jgi:uncharacterized oligopeptide transporter (OPT) family protein
MSFARHPALLLVMMAGRDRTGRPHGREGFLSRLVASDPWLGAIVIAVIAVAGLTLVLIKTTGRLLEGTPWYVRLALLAGAGFGVSRLLRRRSPWTTDRYSS